MALAPGPAGAAERDDGVPTFAGDVSAIFQEKCQACHRPGMMAPMSLLTYQDARPWARSIKHRVMLREMPPWHLDKTVGITRYKGDRSLTDEQIDHFTPGPPDQGQPTHFLPRRVKQLFRIVVPGDFAGEYVWTLSIRGRPESVPGSLKPAQMIDVQKSSSNENTRPELMLGPDLTLTFPASAPLAVDVTDDGLPRPRAGSGSNLNVRWSKYRGPGEVSFGAGESPVEDGRAVTTATVSEPGDYTLAVLADDGSYYGTAQGQGVPGFACCWTFGFLEVTCE